MNTFKNILEQAIKVTLLLQILHKAENLIENGMKKKELWTSVKWEVEKEDALVKHVYEKRGTGDSLGT